MKHTTLIISALLFFLVVNTTYFWEGQLGLAAFPVFLVLVLIYLVLAVILLYQLFAAARQKFEEKGRLVAIAVLGMVLVTTFLSPRGLIDFDSFEADAVLVAEAEGAANCTTRLQLKADHTFKEKTICFGVSATSGSFRISGDTIYFENVKPGRAEDGFYKFAIVRPPAPRFNSRNILVRYSISNDTTGHRLWITKNELHKLKNKSKNNAR